MPHDSWRLRAFAWPSQLRFFVNLVDNSSCAQPLARGAWLKKQLRLSTQLTKYTKKGLSHAGARRRKGPSVARLSLARP